MRFQEKFIGRITGIFFLISMTSAIFGMGMADEIFHGSLEEIFPNRNSAMIGSFIESMNCFFVIGISIGLFLILKKRSHGIAIAYISFRAVEASVLLLNIAIGLILIHLSEEYVNQGAPPDSYHLTIHSLMLHGREVIVQIGIFTCAIGGVLMTATMLEACFVPRVISLLGLIGYICCLIVVPLHLSRVVDSMNGMGFFFFVPGAIFETFVFPFWMILKGFNIEREEDDEKED